MKVLVDIEHSFIRGPIKLALSRELDQQIEFTSLEEEANLIIGTSDINYKKPCVILTDDSHNLITQDFALDISPFPSCQDELDTLVQKIKRLCT